MRTAIGAVLLPVFPVLFLGFVWSVCSAQAEGLDVNWAYTRWLIVFFGLIAFFGFAIILLVLLDTNEEDVDDEPESEPEATILVVSTPEQTSTRRESIAPQLIAATLAGVAGGLLAHFVMKRRDR
ncbi:MAG TPA: hypothetical protein VFZ62_02490 [Candidatus Saccharimonadales bacterium]